MPWLHSDRAAVPPTEVIAFLMLIEYQSAETLNPAIKDGVSTTPPEMVVANSGVRLGLATPWVWMGTDMPVLGSTAWADAIPPGENNSCRAGALMSNDQV